MIVVSLLSLGFGLFFVILGVYWIIGIWDIKKREDYVVCVMLIFFGSLFIYPIIMLKL